MLVPHIGFETFEAMSAKADIALHYLENWLQIRSPKDLNASFRRPTGSSLVLVLRMVELSLDPGADVRRAFDRGQTSLEGWKVRHVPRVKTPYLFSVIEHAMRLFENTLKA